MIGETAGYHNAKAPSNGTAILFESLASKPVRAFDTGEKTSVALAPLAKEMCMDEKLQTLVQKLGNAINEAMAESLEINDVIEQIKSTGHEVTIVLEATIGIENIRAQATVRQGDSAPPVLVFSDSDRKFLQKLKIRVDDDDE